MTEIDSSELLFLEELVLKQETQKYEDMEEEIKKYQEEQRERK